MNKETVTQKKISEESKIEEDVKLFKRKKWSVKKRLKPEKNNEKVRMKKK